MSNIDREMLSREEEGFNIKEFFFKVVAKWRWFAVSVPLCLLGAFYVCSSRTPVYNVSAKVMISDSKKGELGTNTMMKELGFASSDMFVENEMIELESKNLMKEVVQDLELNIRYFREGLLRHQELYNSSPVKILVDNPEKIRDTCFYVLLNAGDEVVLEDADGHVTWKGRFSERVSMNGYHISIERNGEFVPDDKILVTLANYQSAASEFHRNLDVQILTKNTNAVRVSLKDAIPERGVELIRTLVLRYNSNGIENKQVVSAKTVEFINARLEVINKELGTIETDAENFKKTNQLTDITSDAAFVMERKKQTGAELLKLQTELDVVRSIRVVVEKRNADEFALLPENLGVTDEGLNTGIARYNEMVLRRSKLLQSASENNPIVGGLSTQLRELKSSILGTVVSVESGLKIKINSLEKESLSVGERLTSVPTQEKQYRAIARQQELKENLFLFLMQKREESEIAKLIYVATAKIIEDPACGAAPVSPKRAMILLIGLFLGIGGPIGLVFALVMFDPKVRTVDEVRSVVHMPLLGVLPECAGTNMAIETENFMISEVMQLIREKLNYMLGSKDCPVVMVTSSVPGEGKSMLASHLGNAYAKSGIKTLVIGCDLRNPSLHSFFYKNSHKGLSSFLAGMETDPWKLIDQVGDNLYVFLGGVVPPNPMALITSPKMGTLLERLKSEFSCIILDTPPVGILAEGFTLSKHVDACVYLVRVNVLPKEMLTIVADLEKDQHIPNCGIVINGVSIKHGKYTYGYYDQKHDKKKTLNSGM